MEFLLAGNINYPAVVAAVFGSIALGFLWYGPIFGKIWAKEAGWTEEAMKAAQGKSMASTYLLMMIGTIISAVMMTVFINYTDATTWQEGALTGVYLWLGFVAPVQLGAVLWERKSWKYFFINTTYNLVTLAAYGVLFALWI